MALCPNPTLSGLGSFLSIPRVQELPLLKCKQVIDNPSSGGKGHSGSGNSLLAKLLEGRPLHKEIHIPVISDSEA
ncbi:hypothetical protein Tco_0059381 [Tanacetum coccineum]